MDIAIKYEKFDLGDDRYLFKAVSIIKGKYCEETETFETEYGDLCAPIYGMSQYEDNYFGNLISLEDLKKSYKGLTEEEMLMEYYDELKMDYNIGYYDYNIGRMAVASIPYNDLVCGYEDAFNQLEEEQANPENLQIAFDLESLKELLQSNSDEVVSTLRKIVESFSVMGESEYFEVTDKQLKTKPDSSALSLKKEKSKEMTLTDLRKEVKSVIKGQDKAVNDVTRAIIVNQKSENPRHKSHMLIMGPSGTGKTEMVNIIANRLDIPFFKVDSTAYSKEGYVGKSVYSMLNGLITAANDDVEKAQKGILIIDEIDKKTDKGVSGKDVLYSLLKIMDRDIIEVDRGQGYNERQIMFDTSNLTIIFMGAFEDLYKSKEKEANKKSIGFSNPDAENQNKKVVITNEDIIKAGIPAEFLGRIPVVTYTEELDLETLVEILHHSKGGTIDEEKEFCKGLGITIKFTNPYLREIAKKAHATKTGARNLKKLVRESLADAYDEVLSGKKVKVLKITKETANDPKKYYTE